MLAEDERQAKSTEGAANTDCGTVGKPSLTDYRPGIIITTVVRSESKSCPEKTDLQISSRIHRLDYTFGFSRCFGNTAAIA